MSSFSIPISSSTTLCLPCAKQNRNKKAMCFRSHSSFSFSTGRRYAVISQPHFKKKMRKERTQTITKLKSVLDAQCFCKMECPLAVLLPSMAVAAPSNSEEKTTIASTATDHRCVCVRECGNGKTVEPYGRRMRRGDSARTNFIWIAIASQHSLLARSVLFDFYRLDYASRQY